MLTINGVEVFTLFDLYIMCGVKIDALRQRQVRGTLSLDPFITLSGTHYYKAEHVRALMRHGL